MFRLTLLLATVLTVGSLELFVRRDYQPSPDVVEATPNPQQCHYADPFQQECKDDEVAATIHAKPADLKICTVPCKADKDCPTDTCPGVKPKPQCVLSDLAGNTYCGLLCNTNSSTTSSCSYDEHMLCDQPPLAKVGICAYSS